RVRCRDRRTVRGDRPQPGVRVRARAGRAHRRCADRDQSDGRTDMRSSFTRCGVALPAALAVALHAGAASAQSPDDILHYKGADRLQRLIEGARKEGQVVLYSSMIVHQGVRPMADKFSKKYPFIKITYWRADSEDITQKLSAEVRANNVVADVFEG